MNLAAQIAEAETRNARRQLFQYEPYDWQKEFHAAGATYPERMLMAGNRCITPWTWVETVAGPVPAAIAWTSEDVRVPTLVDGSECDVRPENGLFLGIEPAFRLVLDNGQFFDSNHRHRVLTSEGWLSVGQLVSRASGLRLWRKAEDYQASCVEDGYLCDQPLRWAEDTGIIRPPSQAYAQRHARLIFSRRDASDSRSLCTHACRESDHLATPDDMSRHAGLFSAFSVAACDTPVLPLKDYTREFQRLVSESADDLRSVFGDDRGPVFSALFGNGLIECHAVEDRLAGPFAPDPAIRRYIDVIGPGHLVEELCCGAEHIGIFYPFDHPELFGGQKVAAVVPLGYQPIIDAHIPRGNCYRAGGVWHHNTGKSFSAAMEVAFHLTGLYPDWWEGHRFDREIIAWCGSVNNEKSRDVTQWHLLGEEGAHGTGTIPGDCIVGSPTYRQAGIRSVVDIIRVRHVSGGVSTCSLKTYEQGWKTWQGKSVDLVWLDEEPFGQDQDMIFGEAQTRLADREGIMLVTFTPLYGETEMVQHFTSGKRGTYIKGATWDDVAHLSDEVKERLFESFPQHQREARTRGVPMLGEGAVFAIPEDEIKVTPFPIPRHFARICGIDFGIDHPGAGAWVAHDRDQDVLYVYDCYKRSGETSIYHAGAIKQRGDWIPVSWPHDGMNRGPDMKDPLYKQYIAHGVRMLSMSARYDNEKGGRQDVEPIVLEVFERMRTGRFKVFAHLAPWFEEFRGLHRKNGKIVPVRDDIMKATFYAVMMRRFASPELRAVGGQRRMQGSLGAYA